jgi:hypothetical protein
VWGNNNFGPNWPEVEQVNEGALIMKKTIALLLIIFLLSGCFSQDVIPGFIDWESRRPIKAEQFVNALVLGEYVTARENFNSAMLRALNVRKLRRAWEDSVKEAGEFIEIVNTEQLPHEEYDIFLVTTKHENKGIVTRIVFEIENGLISGLHFRFTDIDD